MKARTWGARRFAALCALVMMLVLGGCASSGSEKSRTAGQITDDIAIETSIRSRLVADSSVASRRIEITVFQRTVTLFGRVPDEATRARVLATARQVRGVVAVEDRLTIVTE